MKRDLLLLLSSVGLWMGTAQAAPPPLDAAAQAELAAAREALHSAARTYAALLETHGLPPPGPFGLGDPLRGHLGLRLGPPATDPSGQRGLRIRAVAEDSGAAEAGVQVGDLLLAVNGTALPADADGRTVANTLRDLGIGEPVPLRLARDGQVLNLQVTTTAAPARQRDRHRLPAWQLAEINPGLAPYFGTEQGVLVLRVPQDSRFPLQPGDVITAVDDTAVADPRALFRALMRGEGDRLRLSVRRQGASLTMEGPRPQPPSSPAPDPR